MAGTGLYFSNLAYVRAGNKAAAERQPPSIASPVGSPLLADTGPGGSVNGADFSPDGKLLATADGDGTVRLWNPATRQAVGAPLLADTGPGGSVNGADFSPDGKLLATADGDGTVRLWNIAFSPG